MKYTYKFYILLDTCYTLVSNLRQFHFRLRSGFCKYLLDQWFVYGGDTVLAIIVGVVWGTCGTFLLAGLYQQLESPADRSRAHFNYIFFRFLRETCTVCRYSPTTKRHIVACWSYTNNGDFFGLNGVCVLH